MQAFDELMLYKTTSLCLINGCDSSTVMERASPPIVTIIERFHPSLTKQNQAIKHSVTQALSNLPDSEYYKLTGTPVLKAILRVDLFTFSKIRN